MKRYSIRDATSESAAGVHKSLTVQPSDNNTGVGLNRSLMKKRASFSEYACAVSALFTVLSGAETALGQQERETDVWKAAPSDLSLAVTQVPPVLTVTQVAPTDSALTSTEQGRTTDLDQSFGDSREWRLEKRRQALKDTKFEFNFAPSTSTAATSMAQRNRRGPSADGWE